MESSRGDSSISWLISLIPGLSLVILRQIIQDYDLMGCVKSAGRHQEGPPLRNIGKVAVKIQSNYDLVR